MRICCIADLHVGLKTYAEINTLPVEDFNPGPKINSNASLYDREIEVLNNFKYIINICISQKIPILIIAGDIYHTIQPSSNLQDEINKLLFYASQNNLYVLILEGNHDLKKSNGAVSALEVFDTFHIPHIIHTSKFLDKELIINNEILRFLFLPTYTNNDEIKYLLEQNIINYKHKIIIIGHFTTQGAQLNEWLTAENEDNIDINLFNKANYVILGHLHKRQVLKNNPLIFYTGSLQRTDFNEENQEKGYNILDTNTNQLDFYPIKTQTFYTIEINLENFNLKKSIIEYIKEQIITDKINNSIIRIIINTIEEFKLTIEDEQIIKDYISNYQPKKIVSFKQNIKNNNYVRNENLTESLSLNKALEIYYKDQPRAKERIQLGKEIIKQYFNQ